MAINETYNVTSGGSLKAGFSGAPAYPAANSAFIGASLTGTIPLTVTFTNQSTGNITSYLWDFGDGQTSTSQNPSHVYSSVGTYNVTLTVTGPRGSSSYTRMGYVVASVSGGSLTLGAQFTTISVKAGATTGTLPYSATVLPLRGQVPAGSTVSSSDDTSMRAAILSTHDDGSAAVVVVSGSTTISTANQTKTIAVNVATGSVGSVLTAAAVSALVTNVSVNFGAPYGTASISSFGSPERVWWATPSVICARYRVQPPTLSGTQLEAVIDIHAYSDRALVEVVVENCKVNVSSPVSPGSANYTNAVVNINGNNIATVNGNGAPEGSHSPLRSWYVSAWTGPGNTNLICTQNHTDLQLHPLLFKVAATNSADLSIYASDTYTPWSIGRHRGSNMGAGGDHDSIGPLPRWECRALQSGDYRTWKATEASALAILGFGVNYRDATSGLVPTMAQVAGKTMQNSSWPGIAYDNSAMGWEVAHSPAVGLMAFIGRSSPIFIELAQKVALWNGTWSTYTDGGPAKTTGVFVAAYQMRAWAWGLRSLAHATFLTPDSQSWKGAGQDSLAANITYFDEWRTDSKQTPLSILWDNRVGQPLSVNSSITSRSNFKLWQYAWFIAEIAKIANARVVKTVNQSAIDTLADFVCLHPVKWINDQSTTGAWRYVPEMLVTGTSIQVAPNMTNASDYATQRATWMVDSPPSTVSGTWMSPTLDSANNYATPWVTDNGDGVSRSTSLWAALVQAVDRNVSGAATAWNFVQSNITNINTWLTAFSTDPRSGSIPRNLPPPSDFATGGGTGTYNSTTKLWTPAKAGDGRVYAESWATVPTGEWVQVAGTNLDGMTASITAPGWNSGNLSWQAVLNAWNGFAIDQANSRVWLVGAGGHADSSFNGIMRFDFFKMAWAVEKQPSDRTVWSSQYINLTFPQPGTYTLNQEALMATPQAVAGEVAISGGARVKYYWDQLYWDVSPTSRHVYSTPIYKEDTDELIHGCRTIWRYKRNGGTGGSWDYQRVWDVSLDGAEIAGAYDEATGDYLIGGMGDGIRSSRGYNLTSNTFTTWACPWNGDPWEGVADTRHGRNITVWSPPFSDRTKTNYMVYNLDSRTATTARTTPQYGGGLSAASFRATSSGADGMGMVYVPPLNEYWILYNLAAGMTWLKLDPTTTPWTLSPKTFTGTLPTTRDKPMRKIVWLPALNAVAFCAHETAGFYIYRF